MYRFNLYLYSCIVLAQAPAAVQPRIIKYQNTNTGLQMLLRASLSDSTYLCSTYVCTYYGRDSLSPEESLLEEDNYFVCTYAFRMHDGREVSAFSLRYYSPTCSIKERLNGEACN